MSTDGTPASLGPMMDIAEFVGLGLLHEVNRQFLHPLGLALVVEVRDDGVHVLAGVADCREDPEGVVIGAEQLSPEKAARVRQLQLERGPERMRGLGFIVQPVE